MSEWLAQHLLASLVDQTGTWLVGVVLAVLGAFSTRLVESIKFALNRADLRAKYYDEMAIDVSHVVFIVERLIKVYYEADWASEDIKGGIANEYNEAMNTIWRKEYVYLSWVHRFWGKRNFTAFESTTAKMRLVDAALIKLNEHESGDKDLTQLKLAYDQLHEAAHSLLISSI